MRSLVALLIITLAACGARTTHVSVRTPAHTVDDRVEMSFECTRTNRVASDSGWDTEVTQVPSRCTPRALTMRGDGGAVVHTTLPADGEVSAVVPGPGAPPRAWQVEADGLPIGTVHKRTYRGVTATLDLLVVGGIVTSFRMLQGEDDEGAAYLFLGSAVLYAAGTPIAHAVHGNRGQAWRSVARRLAVPAITGLANLIPRECSSFETDPWECEISLWIAGITVTLVSAPILMIWDYVRAEVTTGLPLVTPTVSSDGERTVLGVAGRF